MVKTSILLKLPENTIIVIQIHELYIWNFIKIQHFWRLSSGIQHWHHPDVIALIWLIPQQELSCFGSLGKINK